MYFYCYVYVPTGTLRLPWLRFFLSCKANALFQNFCVIPRIVCFVSFCVLFVCKSVLYYRHRLETQLQLTNIYHITLFFHGNTGYANAPRSYVYTYTACLLVTVCQEYGPSGTHAPIITNLLQMKTPNEPLENAVRYLGAGQTIRKPTEQVRTIASESATIYVLTAQDFWGYVRQM